MTFHESLQSQILQWLVDCLTYSFSKPRVIIHTQHLAHCLPLNLVSYVADDRVFSSNRQNILHVNENQAFRENVLLFSLNAQFLLKVA